MVVLWRMFAPSMIIWFLRKRLWKRMFQCLEVNIIQTNIMYARVYPIQFYCLGCIFACFCVDLNSR